MSKWYSGTSNIEKSWKQVIRGDVLERKNEKNMLNLNKSNVICNETMKLCAQISLWSDKKMKKGIQKVKMIVTKMKKKVVRKVFCLVVFAMKLLENMLHKKQKCWKNEDKVKWSETKFKLDITK